MTLIAVNGATLKETFSGGSPSVASKSITTPPSAKCKAEGKGMYRGSLSCSYTLSPPSGFDTPPTLSFSLTISAGAQKMKADGQAVVLKGDKSAAGSWSFSNSTSGATLAGTITCEIDDPAQTKVKAV